MAYHVVKTIFNRFRRDEIDEVLREWNYLEENEIKDVIPTGKTRKTKTDIVNQLARKCMVSARKGGGLPYLKEVGNIRMINPLF